MRYVPVVVFSIVYNAVSLGLGVSLTRVFKMPAWTTPAIAFNNTTSLPLLLVSALATTGILHSIDSSDDAVARAKSYFLVNATIGNCLTFTVGPKLLTNDSDETPQRSDEGKTTEDLDAELEAQEHEAEESNEETSLLPNSLARAEARTYYTTTKHLHRLPLWTQRTLSTITTIVFNPPIIGASLGALIGLVPPLHRLFFATQQEGGYFNAWLTSALSNVGELFVALQVVVIGVKLSVAVLKFKHGERSGRVPWSAFSLIIAMRFVIWPAISIFTIYGLAKYTGVLSEDKILWFAMMLMPCGPSALNLTALADVGGSGEEEKLGIAKVLTAEYVVSPLICLAVVAALKACESV